ncbi:MAG: tetratricopeptide repeat protein [Bacteroidota bacterium]
MINELDPYLNNDLSPEEEEMITQNLIQLKFEEEKKAVWRKKIETDYPQIRGRKIFSNRVLTLFLLAVAVVLITALLYFTRSESPTHVQFAQQLIYEMEPIQDPDILRKGTSSIDQKRATAMFYFSNKNFKSALKIYDELNSIKALNKMDCFYKGMCHLKLSNYDSAIEYYTQALELGGPEEELNWAMALAYTCQNDMQQAIPLLNSIITNNDFGAGQAREILAKVSESEQE